MGRMDPALEAVANPSSGIVGDGAKGNQSLKREKEKGREGKNYPQDVRIMQLI